MFMKCEQTNSLFPLKTVTRTERNSFPICVFFFSRRITDTIIQFWKEYFSQENLKERCHLRKAYIMKWGREKNDEGTLKLLEVTNSLEVVAYRFASTIFQLKSAYYRYEDSSMDFVKS